MKRSACWTVLVAIVAAMVSACAHENLKRFPIRVESDLYVLEDSPASVAYEFDRGAFEEKLSMARKYCNGIGGRMVVVFMEPGQDLLEIDGEMRRVTYFECGVVRAVG